MVTGTVICGDYTETNIVTVWSGCPDPADSHALIDECQAEVSDTSAPYWKVAEHHPEDFVITQALDPFGYCDTGTFTLTFENKENIGDITAFGSLIITDTLPAGLMYVYAVFTETKPVPATITPDFGPNPGDTDVLIWVLPEDTDFEPQDLITLELHVKNDTTQACADFADSTNSVHILMQTSKGDTYGFGPETHDTASSFVTELDPAIDIDTLTFTDQTVNDGLVPGDTVTYDIYVCNTGDGAARDVVITDEVDTDLEDIVMSTTHGGTFADTWDTSTYIATWWLQQLDAGACDTFTVTAKVIYTPGIGDSTPIDNHATATEEDCCGSTDQDTFSIMASLNVPQMVFAKDLAVPTPPDMPSVGDRITFSIDYHNTGSSRATGVIIYDTLPVELDYVGSSGDYTAVDWDPVTRLLTFNVGTVESDSSGTVYIVADIKVGNVSGIINPATITYNDDNGNPRDPISDTATVTTERLVLSKTAPAEATPGETITYRITYRNVTVSTIAGVVITDTLPDTVTFVSASPVQSDSTGGIIRWDIGDVAPSAEGTLTITVVINQTAPDQEILVNPVLLTSDAGDSLTDTATTIVRRPHMAVDKAADCCVENGIVPFRSKTTMKSGNSSTTHCTQ